jgi:hypothetical protein
MVLFKKYGLCASCAERGHLAKDCKVPRKCLVCDKAHNTTKCRQLPDDLEGLIPKELVERKAKRQLRKEQHEERKVSPLPLIPNAFSNDLKRFARFAMKTNTSEDDVYHVTSDAYLKMSKIPVISTLDISFENLLNLKVDADLDDLPRFWAVYYTY